MAGEVNVGTLEATLELVDSLTPTAGQMIDILDQLAEAMGTTREAVLAGQISLEQMAEAGRVIDDSLREAGISVEAFADFLDLQREALIQSADAMLLVQSEALQMNEGFDRAAQYMEELQMEAIEMDAALTQASGALDKAGESAGGAVVNVEKFLNALLKGSIGDALSSFMELPAIFATISAAATKGWAEIEKFAGAMEKLSQKAMTTGVGVETLQRWQRAAENAGGSVEQLTRAMLFLDRAVEGNKKSLSTLGVTAEQLKKMTPQDELELVARKLFAITDESKRNVAGMQILGRQWMTLAPILKEIADGGGDVALVLGKEDVEAGNRLDSALDVLSGSWKDLKSQVVAFIATSENLRGFLQWLADSLHTVAIAVNEFRARWEELSAATSQELYARYMGYALAFEKAAKEGKNLNEVWQQQPELQAAIEAALKKGAKTTDDAARILKELAVAHNKAGEAALNHADGIRETGNVSIAAYQAAKDGAKVVAEETTAITGNVAETLKLKWAKQELDKATQLVGREVKDLAEAHRINSQAALLEMEHSRVLGDQQKLLKLQYDISRTGVEAQSKAILALSQAGVTLPPALEKIAQSERDAAKAVMEMNDALRQQQEANASADQLAIVTIMRAVESGVLDEATQQVVDMAKSLSAAGMPTEKLVDEMVRLGADTTTAKAVVAQLGPQFDEARGKANRLADEAMGAVNAKALTMAESIYKGTQSTEGLKERLMEAGVSAEVADRAIQTIETNAAKADAKTGDWAIKMSQVAEGAALLANMLGGGGLGNIVGIIGSAAQATASYGDRMKDLGKQMKEAKTEEEKAGISKQMFSAKIGLASSAASMLAGVLGKSKNATMQQAAAALEGAAAGAKMGASFGPIGAAVGGAIGAIAGFINKGKQMKAEVTKMYDEFVKSAGGLDKLKESAAAAGVSIEEVMKNKGTKNVEKMKQAIEDAKAKMDAFKAVADKVGVSTMKELEIKAKQAGISLKEVFDAKTVEQYKAAMEKVGKQFDLWNEANEKLNSAMDKYGITIDQLGPKMRQQKLDEQALTLFEDWQLLIGAGVDMNVLIEKMGPNMNEYINTAVKAGATIPQAMKPAIDAMFQQGKLIHENGQAYTQAEYEALKYGTTQAEMFDKLIDKITQLVNALLGIPSEVNTDVNVNTNTRNNGGGANGEPPEPGDRGDGQHSYAAGSGGFRNFGMGTTAVLHGTERVQTSAQYQQEQQDIAGAVSAAIASQTSQLAKVFRDAVLKGV